ncbi:MAG: hypothetical protein K1060chlam5_00535 [Candidatus Anoxychlamydiales bacterium]|nr:hypothetical protein [Candidatus Anoxychlamydiales bacterium]
MNYLNNINNAFYFLNDINNFLDSKYLLNSHQIINIQDELNQIRFVSNKIKKSVVNEKINKQILQTYEKIEELENIRIIDDEILLEEIHKLLLAIDILTISFEHLSYENIEKCLDILDQKYDDLLHIRAFNQKYIDTMFLRAKNKLDDIHFRVEFPIVEELDENKDSFSHRAILETKKNKDKQKVIKKKLEEFNKLIEIAKNFMYVSNSNIDFIFNNLNQNIQKKIEQNVFQIANKNIKNLKSNKNEIISKAIMMYIANEINNSY